MKPCRMHFSSLSSIPYIAVTAKRWAQAFFGLCLTLVFIARFFIEFVKDIQVDFEAGMAFNMGQLLSIPFLIIGIACMVDSNWKRKLGAHSYLEDLDKKKQEKK